jgi:hypothetical protein
MLSAARAADPLDIKVGWVTMYASSVPLSLDKKELLHHYGQSYTISPIRIASTAAMITGLATGDVNVGTLAYSSLTSAILNAKLNDPQKLCGTDRGPHGALDVQGVAARSVHASHRICFSICIGRSCPLPMPRQSVAPGEWRSCGSGPVGCYERASRPTCASREPPDLLRVVARQSRCVTPGGGRDDLQELLGKAQVTTRFRSVGQPTILCLFK